MTPSAWLLSFSVLLGAFARAEDSARIQLRMIGRDLQEAFVTGRPPAPSALGSPVLRDLSRLGAEDRASAESLIGLARQVAEIQAGTDGSGPAQNAQLSNIRRTARLLESRFGAAGGMPPEPVIKIYLEPRRAGAAAGPPAREAAAAIPDKNRAGMERVLKGAFDASRDPESGTAEPPALTAEARPRAPDAERSPRADDFRPALPRLAIKAPPAAAPADLKPEKGLYRRIMDDGYRTFTEDQKLVNLGMADYKGRRAGDCASALSSACMRDYAMLGYGFLKSFLNATGERLTGAPDAGAQAKEAGKLAVELSPVGGIEQIADDYDKHGLRHFAKPANFGLAALGILPFGRTLGEVIRGGRAVGRGASVLAEARQVGQAAIDDSLGATSRTAAAAAQVERASRFKYADMRRMGPGFEAEDAANGIRHLTAAERAQWKLSARGGALRTPQGPLPPGNYLYVMDEFGDLYVHPGGAGLRHSSLVLETEREASEFTVPGAKAGVEKNRLVRVAGHLCVGKKGKILGLNRASGHFRPAREDLAETVSVLTGMGASVPSSAVHWDYIGTVPTPGCN